MKRKLKIFLGFCVALLAAYAAVDLLSENYLQKTTRKPEVKPKKSFYKSMYIPSYRFKLKDGSECKGVFWIRDLDTDKPKITFRDLHCKNYFIRNVRLPEFTDDMVIGKQPEPQRDNLPGWQHIPGIP